MTKEAQPLAKSEMVYRELREKIISGRYGTGYRLVLGQIARDAGVSPVPVREAIRRLEAEKLVTFTPNVGAEVASVDVGRYAEVLEALAYLEGAATALAASHLTVDQLAVAEAINEEMRRLVEGQFDAEQFTKLNRRFHEALWVACPNKYLIEMVEHEWERIQLIRRNDFAFAPNNAPVSVREHAHLLRLIRSNDSLTEIEHAARNHKLRTRRVFVDTRSS
ncbi:GntR family transcriptional regulator [Tessaracoccus oleiagri]|uniref:DNA-binding transcriptional regulator, GntR family n=1 Tax=Tessaracoccus oleiagri TaxID=686624 RepID=A0A1G9HCZ7_9ACTN|nr:GntR family transcriptional regulator [Tessaracoccus oleiagri]SDL10594.1 DNA-binding transcriptional regulator, GntR family [Tessaracoccus oleiagri]